MPEYFSALEAAANWGIKNRRVALLCKEGRIPGAYKLGASWAIPAGAEKPADPRKDKGNKAETKTPPKSTQSKPISNTYADMEKLSAPFRALINNAGLNYQILDLLPIPIEIFAPDGLSIFMNRAFMEMVNHHDERLIVGKYNLKNDPVCLGIIGQDLMDRIFRGEACSFSDFPAPIQDIFDRGAIDEKPWEAATMDLFALPLWNGDTFICSIMFFTVKNMYHGNTDIAKAKQYIDEHWLDEFDLEKTARFVGIGSRHFRRIFKEVEDCTPMEYYQGIKIEKIQEMLHDRTLSIEQAFEACGVDYRGKTYLSLFKEKTGQSPSEFRKANMK